MRGDPVVKLEEIKEALKEPAAASVALGAASLALAVPLWLLIPIVLVVLGLGIYLVVSFLPFVVAGIIFVLTYWLLKRVGMREPYVYVLPLALGLLSLIPAFIPEMQGAIVSSLNVGARAMGVLETAGLVLKLMR